MAAIICRRISLLLHYWKGFRDALQSSSAMEASQFLWSINHLRSDGCVIFFSCWCWEASRLTLNSLRRAVLSQTITGFTPPAKKAARPLNFEEESRRGCSSDLWTHLEAKSNVASAASYFSSLYLTLNFELEEEINQTAISQWKRRPLWVEVSENKQQLLIFLLLCYLKSFHILKYKVIQKKKA